MNYFAHGRDFIDDPFFLAGTALPDWLSVVDRRVRARARLAAVWIDDSDRCLASLARGVVQHHADDRWFHQTRTFTELSLQFSQSIRQQLDGDDGYRPSFLGHILVEILLDAALIQQDPARLDAYYAALEWLDLRQVGQAANQLMTGAAPQLPQMIHLFCAERFLYDYTDDAKLLVRLNRVMRRVKLPELPSSFVVFFPDARWMIRDRLSELLVREQNRQQGET